LDQNGLIKNEFQIEINRNNKILQILWLNNTLSSKLLVCIPDGIMVNRRISFLRAISQRFRREKKAILSFLLRVIFFSRSLTIFHHSSLINLFAVCDVIFTGFLSEQMVGVQLESKSS
jgi:hypothetical protein